MLTSQAKVQINVYTIVKYRSSLEEFSNRARRFLRSWLSADQQPEDVLQDIFIRIHQGIDDLKDEDQCSHGFSGSFAGQLLITMGNREETGSCSPVQIS